MNLLETAIEGNVFEVHIKYDDLRISRREVELTLGYMDAEIPPHFSGMIDDALLELKGRCEIKAGYRLTEVARPPGRYDGLLVGGNFLRMDKIVTSQLKKSERAAVFVCTIGSSMETWARGLMKDGDPAMGYIADTTASVAAEAVTNLLHDHIGERMLSQGMRITNRYSPGYCNWSVSEQHLLFSLLPKDFCGVTLSESALMSPIKSVSGVIGVGTLVRRKDYICDRCGVKDCTYRSKRPAATNQKTSHIETSGT